MRNLERHISSYFLSFFIIAFALINFFYNEVFLDHTLRTLSSERWSINTQNSSSKPLEASLAYTIGSDLSLFLGNRTVLTSGPPLCPREQIFPGFWRPVLLDQPPYISKTMHLRCKVKDFDYENPGPWSSYEWEPNNTSCHLSTWNATSFCNLIPFATVSIIGDSLSWEQYSSLIQLLGRRVHQSDQHASRLEERNVVYVGCQGLNHRSTKFVFRNDAQLNVQTVVNSIEHDFPMIMILNRGAHYVPDSELRKDLQELLPVLLQWQSKCRVIFQTNCLLFWRTTVPGHTQCDRFTLPVNNLSAMESWIQSKDNYDNETIWNFHWQDFQRQNRIVLDLFHEFSITSGLQYEVLDAYELNILRPDGHRWHQNDCLHNCYPGKMDVYNQLLLHFLKMHRSSADAQQLIDRFEKFQSSLSNRTTT